MQPFPEEEVKYNYEKPRESVRSIIDKILYPIKKQNKMKSSFSLKFSKNNIQRRIDEPDPTSPQLLIEMEKMIEKSFNLSETELLFALELVTEKNFFDIHDFISLACTSRNFRSFFFGKSDLIARVIFPFLGENVSSWYEGYFHEPAMGAPYDDMWFNIIDKNRTTFYSTRINCRIIMKYLHMAGYGYFGDFSEMFYLLQIIRKGKYMCHEIFVSNMINLDQNSQCLPFSYSGGMKQCVYVMRIEIDIPLRDASPVGVSFSGHTFDEEWFEIDFVPYYMSMMVKMDLNQRHEYILKLKRCFSFILTKISVRLSVRFTPAGTERTVKFGNGKSLKCGLTGSNEWVATSHLYFNRINSADVVTIGTQTKPNSVFGFNLQL